MANYLLSMQFNSSGCTDKTVINLGGVSFNHTTSLGRAAYFQPYNVQAGFKIDNSNIKTAIENNSWCIYFKYKIREEDLLTNTPIIVYYRNKEYHEFITIENKKSIILYIADVPFALTDIGYTFDNEWHTFYTCFENGNIKLFIDGYLYNSYTTNNTPEFGEIFYIGTDTINSNLCGYLNDITIFDGIIYRNNFVPPNKHINTSDTKNNYKGKSYTNKDDFEPELIDSIEHNREQTATRLIEVQKSVSTRFLKLTWHQITDGYFSNIDYHFNIHYNEIIKGIYINITGIDTTLLTNNDKYFNCNLETALELKKIHPLMIFVNRQFVKLSKIKLIKSDNWYTLFIEDVGYLNYKTIVKELDIILLPFDVIYEEDYGERADLFPLYSFDLEGRFSASNANTFYYINDKANPFIKHIGVREYHINDPEYQQTHLAFIWRYGRLVANNININNGTSMQFIPDDNRSLLSDETYRFDNIPEDTYGHLLPGTNVIIYAGSTLVDPSLYRVVSTDTIYFDNLDDVYMLNNRVITMQIITGLAELPNPKKDIMDDLTDIKLVEVEATEEDQSVFDIPEAPIDRYGRGYRLFNIFKGHIFMNEHERYIRDYENNQIRIINQRDYVHKGRHLLFLFGQVEKASSSGSVSPKSVTYLVKPNSDNLSKVTVPVTNKKLTRNNCVLFVNSAFISPYRYTISNNIITMTDNFKFDPNSIIMIHMLELVNDFEDLATPRGRIIKPELDKGRRYILYDLGIPKEIKISLANLLCFDQHGWLINELKGHVYNYNIIKYLEAGIDSLPTYLTCVYTEDTFKNKANIIRFNNRTFLQEYIIGREEFYEMDIDFDKLLADFDFEYSNDLSYGENLSKALNYIMSYNQNVLDDVYEKRSTAFINTITAANFNSSLISKNQKFHTSLPRDEYETNKVRTYPMFFVDGVLTDWDMQENANSIDITLSTKPSNSSKINSINFKGMKNFLYNLSTKLSSNKKVLKNISATIKVQ